MKSEVMRIVKAREAGKPIFEKFLDLYLGELSTYREMKVGAKDFTSYPYLDLC